MENIGKYGGEKEETFYINTYKIIMSLLSSIFGGSSYQGKTNYTDDILKERADNLSMVDLQRMFELKQQEQSAAGYTVSFKISNHYFEIIMAIVIIYIAYRMFIADYVPASVTFLIVAFYLLFLLSAQRSSSLDYEVPWTDCPDYFIRMNKNGSVGEYVCRNVSPESVPGPGYDRVKQINGLSDSLTRNERCALASGYQGLSWEWCDDPRNQ
jgi:hypothetical protein